MHACTHAYIHLVYIHTHIHTYIHTGGVRAHIISVSQDAKTGQNMPGLCVQESRRYTQNVYGPQLSGSGFVETGLYACIYICRIVVCMQESR